tara:strand:- start:350 stop:802 length:453 start_codon:yes stop_codon:yes gene_type:complete
MNKLTKNFLIITIFLSSILGTAKAGNSWEVYYEDTQLKISFCQIQCDLDNQFNQEFVVLKIENLTSNTLLVQWDSKIWFDESCINCEQDSPEFRKEIRIESKKIMEGNCSEHNALRIFSRFTDNLEDMPGVDKIIKLTKFELKNLTIKDE